MLSPRSLQCLLSHVLLLLSLTALGQPLNNTWREFYSLRNGKGLSISERTIYLYTPHAVLSYQPNDGEITRFTTLKELSRSGITSTHFSPENERLIVAYQDGTIDIVGQRGSCSIGTLRENGELGLESPIRQITTHKGHIYALSSNQLYALSESTQHIEEQYRVWSSDKSTTLSLNAFTSDGNSLYIATNDGVYIPNSPLPATRTFSKLGTLERNITHIAASDDASSLLAIRAESSSYEIWLFAQNVWTLLQTLTLNEPTSLTYANGQFLLCDGSRLISLTPEGAMQTLWDDALKTPEEQLKPQEAYIHTDGTIYIASGKLGLTKTQGGTTQCLSPETPNFSSVHAAFHDGQQLHIIAGGIHENRQPLGIPFAFYSTSNNGGYNTEIEGVSDALCITSASDAAEHLLIGTSNGGLLEFRNGQLTQRYNSENSTLKPSLYTGTIRVDGIIRTPDGSWWMHNPGVDKPLSVRLETGDWQSFSLPTHTNGTPVIFALAPNGDLWLAAKGSSRATHINREKFLSSNGTEGYAVHPVLNNTNLNESLISDLRLDQAGTLWLATDAGVLHCRTPESTAHGESLLGTPIFLPDPVNPHYAAYLGGLIPFTSLLIDHGDRVWVGARHAGLYHIDPKNKSVIRKYTPENSPLPSGHILSLTLSENNGELFIATDGGVLSLKIDTQTPATDYSDIRVYPNPIRPGYSGNLHIDGLMQGTTLKITDVAGNLVREIESSGGRAVWDQRNGLGTLVRTGVYLIFCSNEDGKQTEVTKVAIIR